MKKIIANVRINRTPSHTGHKFDIHIINNQSKHLEMLDCNFFSEPKHVLSYINESKAKNIYVDGNKVPKSKLIEFLSNELNR